MGRAQGRAHLQLFREVWQIQQSSGRSCSGKNPESSDAWEFLGDLPGAHWGKICQCMFGLVNPVTNVPWRKATWLVFSQEHCSTKLDNGICLDNSMCDKNHDHDVTEGSVGGVRKSKLAEHYNESLCGSILSAIPQLSAHRRQRKVESSYAACNRVPQKGRPNPNDPSAVVTDKDVIKSLCAVKQQFVHARDIKDDQLLHLKEATGLDVLMVQGARKAIAYRTCTHRIPEATKRVTFASWRPEKGDAKDEVSYQLTGVEDVTPQNQHRLLPFTPYRLATVFAKDRTSSSSGGTSMATSSTSAPKVPLPQPDAVESDLQ